MAMALAGSSLTSSPLKRPHLLTPPIPRIPRSSLKPPSLPCTSASASKLSSPRLPHAHTHAQTHPNLAATALAGSLFAALASSQPSLAAQQIAELAADDNRGLALLLPLLPAVAWVLYNILQPALNQLNRMRSAKGLAVGVGLGAAVTLLATPHAFAAQEIAQIADSDSRGLVLLGVLIPAVGWVLYNILQPGLNQINRMRSSKGVIGALGLAAASMLFSPHADAAVQELASIADDDSRGLLLLGVVIPALGWVLYNILQPALNQLNKMRSAKGLVGTVGLGATVAALLSDQEAEAAQEISQLAADGDNRPLILLVVLIPAVGWVLFNILQPALNQFNKMRSGK